MKNQLKDTHFCYLGNKPSPLYLPSFLAVYCNSVGTFCVHDVSFFCPYIHKYIVHLINYCLTLLLQYTTVWFSFCSSACVQTFICIPLHIRVPHGSAVHNTEAIVAIVVVVELVVNINHTYTFARYNQSWLPISLTSHIHFITTNRL